MVDLLSASMMIVVVVVVVEFVFSCLYENVFVKVSSFVERARLIYPEKSRFEREVHDSFHREVFVCSIRVIPCTLQSSAWAAEENAHRGLVAFFLLRNERGEGNEGYDRLAATLNIIMNILPSMASFSIEVDFK